MLAEVSDTQVFLFSILVLGVFFLFFFIAYASWKLQQEENGPSPYSGMPLMSGTRLPIVGRIRVELFLKSFHQYENRSFDMSRAAICRETGRIFPQSRIWPWKYEVDWDFLQKRFPGHYVSWGSLSHDQQRTIREAHDGRIVGFETDFSCFNPLPKDIDKVYALHDLGPLYVDIDTKVLIGWQKVPETELEVLIVQKPTKIITISVPKEMKNK